MAAGDLLFSRATEDGVCVVPCCCSVSNYGETITLVISGILPCGCVSGQKIDNISIPGSFDLIYDGVSQWLSGIIGSADVYTGDIDCGGEPISRPISFVANCNAQGMLFIAGDVVGVAQIFAARYSSLGTSKANEHICDGIDLVGGGTGSI